MINYYDDLLLCLHQLRDNYSSEQLDTQLYIWSLITVTESLHSNK